MNTLFKSHFHKAEIAGLHRENVWFVRNTNGSTPDQSLSRLRWLKATFRTIESRRDDLERAHWKKVWRSMFEDRLGGVES